MNPSTEEILRIIENLPADQVIHPPNNKNIVLAAQTASTNGNQESPCGSKHQRSPGSERHAAL
jgi:dihydroxyacetone kinase-like predicted kinase